MLHGYALFTLCVDINKLFMETLDTVATTLLCSKRFMEVCSKQKLSIPFALSFFCQFGKYQLTESTTTSQHHAPSTIFNSGNCVFRVERLSLPLINKSNFPVPKQLKSSLLRPKKQTSKSHHYTFHMFMGKL